MPDNDELGRWKGAYLGTALLARLKAAGANIQALRAAGVPLPNVGLEELQHGHHQVGSAVARMAVGEWLARYEQPLEIAVNQMEAERERGQANADEQATPNS